MKIIQQKEFSSILFDTLFGLILFFGLDSFMDIHGLLPFIFYIFSTFILIHWWLVFKSADDAFSEEVTDSAVDLVFGIIYIILIEYIILNAKLFSVAGATTYLIALLAVDLVWALAWRYVGNWNTTDRVKIKSMEKELNHNIRVNCVAIVVFGLLLTLAPALSSAIYIATFIIFYILYVVATFKTKIIDLRIF
jgi:hypothetical protein